MDCFYNIVNTVELKDMTPACPAGSSINLAQTYAHLQYKFILLPLSYFGVFKRNTLYPGLPEESITVCKSKFFSDQSNFRFKQKQVCSLAPSEIEP
jgi:hypothetical protein